MNDSTNTSDAIVATRLNNPTTIIPIAATPSPYTTHNCEAELT